VTSMTHIQISLGRWIGAGAVLLALAGAAVGGA